MLAKVRSMLGPHGTQTAVWGPQSSVLLYAAIFVGQGIEVRSWGDLNLAFFKLLKVYLVTFLSNFTSVARGAFHSALMSGLNAPKWLNFMKSLWNNNFCAIFRASKWAMNFENRFTQSWVIHISWWFHDSLIRPVCTCIQSGAEFLIVGKEESLGCSIL